uniref:BRO1 domain-containing protein n=1 Tax=Ascaris lumbricoides TaxID=6252 RepID=A0A0M3IEH6_ASCLU
MAMMRNLGDYFKSLNTLLAAESWRMAEEAAKLFSVKGPHAHYKFLQIETAANERRPQIDSIFDDLACLHLVVLHALSKQKFAHAFSTQAQVSENLSLCFTYEKNR